METQDRLGPSRSPMTARSNIKFDSPQLRTDAITLERLLSRLSDKILSDRPDSRLRHSHFERTKTAANIDFAQRLKLRLQENLPNTKNTNERKQQHAILAQYTSTIKQLRDRLQQLAQQDDGKYEAPESEDLVAKYCTPSPPTITHSTVPAISQPPTQSPILPHPDPSTPLSSHPPTLSPKQASALRNRFPQNQPPAQAYTSQSSTSQAPRSTTTLLASNTTTQAEITSSLLTTAQALKASSQAIADSLEGEKPLLSNTVSALDKNTDGMQAAGQKMGVLRRMSEGQGWWGRMMLYAWIMGLWIAALMLVFVLPKLRF